MSAATYFRNIFLSLAFVSAACSPVLADTPEFDRRPPLAELWVQTSAEYRGLCYQAYGAAAEHFEDWAALLEKRTDGKAYLPGSDKPVAIVLDLDETVIDNSGFQAFTIRTGADYSPELWRAWVDFQAINEAAGKTVPGAAEFLRKVEEMGVTPIYISNRDVGYEQATAKVLERAGLDMTGIEDRILLRHEAKAREEQAREAMKALGMDPDAATARTVIEGEGEKEGRRLLARQNYDVLAYFGDVYGDFLPFVTMAEDTLRHFEQRQASADQHRDKWGSVWYILPNPMYGSWSVGQAIPRDEVKSSLNDYGFEVYLRGRRKSR